MNDGILHRIWRIIRIPFYIILALYIGLVIYRIPAAQERLNTQEVVKKIQAQKLTLADVMGQNHVWYNLEKDERGNKGNTKIF